MASTGEPIYHALDPLQKETRTLSLLPGHEDDPVRCELQTISLAASPPSFEAVSYVWGDVKARTPILLHDQPFEAPASAVDVLQRFRLPTQTRIIWIDAVCINQADL